MSRRSVEVTPDLMLRAYRAGWFPMAETRQGQRLHWVDPEQRGIMPLDRFHVPRRLLRTVLSNTYQLSSNRDFAAVIAGCAGPAPGREDTWINPEIERLFTTLHEMGHAHSVETWQDGVLVGGLYGVVLGGAFFGESMFNRARDASKVALVNLVARLRLGGFSLLDAQFLTNHLSQFGTIEIPREDYKKLLADAVARPAAWPNAATDANLRDEIQAIAKRSAGASD